MACLAGYKGQLCEENIDDCNPKPCHHGTCKDGIASYKCECDPGYTGAICNVQIQECLSSPCQNGGRCIDRVNMYQCVCPTGTSGERNSPVLPQLPPMPSVLFATRPLFHSWSGQLELPFRTAESR